MNDEEEVVQYPLAEAQRVLLQHDPQMVALAEDQAGSSLLMKAVAADNLALFGVLVKVCKVVHIPIEGPLPNSSAVSCLWRLSIA